MDKRDLQCNLQQLWSDSYNGGKWSLDSYNILSVGSLELVGKVIELVYMLVIWKVCISES